MQQQLDAIVAMFQEADDLRQSIIRNLGSSSVALFAILDDHGGERLELAGSGTLVDVGGSYYILTAAHVWEKKLKSAVKLGITLTDNINHNRSIDICTVVPTTLKPDGGQWSEWGPDLALLRIPPEYVGGIKAYQVFVDPTEPGRLLNLASLEVWAIVGTPEELGTFTSRHADIQISGSFVVPQYQRRGEHDYYDFKMDTTVQNVPKKSFGGISGGGLWRILIYQSPETGKIDWLHRLKGVASYEFLPREPRIRCHGPKSITAVMGVPVELDINTLADAYLHNITQGGRDKWACDEVRQFIRRDLSRGFGLILLVLDNAESDQMAETAAATPLLELLDVHGNNALERVERACDGNRRLQLALSRVLMPSSHELYSRWYVLKCKYGLETKN